MFRLYAKNLYLISLANSLNTRLNESIGLSQIDQNQHFDTMI